jgi:hypothetical protein
MRIPLDQPGELRLRKIVAGLTLGAVLVTVAVAPAYADDRQDRGREGNAQRNHGRSAGGDRDWREHEGSAHRYWGHPEPRVIYAPPVVYSPPPEYEAPGFNLILPLRIH